MNDTVTLNEISVSAYFTARPVLRLPSAAAVIDSMGIAESSSVPEIYNRFPGVRMEERSPGSLRLSIRGSLLRSPFGIRNVKIYIADFPFTDAGGNTYLNLPDHHAFSDIEVIKGPDGSVFGANSGGVIRLNPFESQDKLSLTARLKGGSYNSIRSFVQISAAKPKLATHLFMSHNHSDGYRDNSDLSGTFLMFNGRYNYIPNAKASWLLFYSDLAYSTPGGLTIDQYSLNPRMARPATAVFPGATEQQAGVKNKTIFSGIRNEYSFSSRFSHVVSLAASFTDFENPFITNFEFRDECNIALRTWLQYDYRMDNGIRIRLNGGIESVSGMYAISNYGNNRGSRDTLQSEVRSDVRNSFAFIHTSMDVSNKLLFEVSVSLNNNIYSFRGSDSEVTSHPDDVIMPRFAASWLMNDRFAFRMSSAKGYSPPSAAEMRASDQQINQTLNAESGWNYEAGMRYRSLNGILWADLSAYQFELKDAIVRKTNDGGDEYFVNAGSVIQKGTEALLTLNVPVYAGILNAIDVQGSCTISNYKFGEYTSGDTDYSGNKMTGIPDASAYTMVKLKFRKNIYLKISWSNVSSMPLNDGNTVYATSSDVINLEAGYAIVREKHSLHFNAGILNVTDEVYSLGYDLNAAGGRYYNAAPGRNYFAGITIKI